MPIVANYCKAEIRFICSTHKQIECVYFEKEWRQAFNSPTTCFFGLPDRKCSNDKAIKQAIEFYIYMRDRNEKSKKKKV